MMIKLKDNAIGNIVVLAIVVAIAAGGLATGLFVGHLSTNLPIEQTQGKTGASSSGSFQLILVITTNNYYNASVGDQPAFFVLQNGTLQSAANITIPANQKIEMTIIDYDDGNGSVASIYANVTGTLNGKETIVNNTNVNSTNANNQIAVNGSEQVSSVPVENIAHTFTVQNGSNIILNIPIEPSSVVQATFELGPGSYTWQCEVACGSGSTGWQGAMDSPGWMTGTLTAN
ncbi:MAG: hypothetical protein M0Z77_07550 [Thermoplasmatales archaeon]|nr:hypothetical protein [Candidatus Thermoplasmatota archaeon]MCL6002231.1 hypothetical protein [Candidatus Thermoplasmatota archaeon]MDA8055486.1 hypothetical protein [Thermoplasmatales archaeon]